MGVGVGQVSIALHPPVGYLTRQHSSAELNKLLVGDVSQADG